MSQVEILPSEPGESNKKMAANNVTGHHGLDLYPVR